MAWFAELKRRQWYCIVGLRMNRDYSHILYDEWYSSLSEEEKQELERKRIIGEEARQEHINAIFERFNIMHRAVSGVVYRNNVDKYHGVYDEYGFPRI